MGRYPAPYYKGRRENVWEMGEEGEIGVEEEEPVQGMGGKKEERVRVRMVLWKRIDKGGEVQ